MDAARCSARRQWPGCAAPSFKLKHVGDVVALHGLHEALCHAVTLRAAHRGRQWQQADLPGKGASLLGGIGRAVIAQPLHRRRGKISTEALLDGLQHHIADIVTAVATRAGTQLIALRSQQPRLCTKSTAVGTAAYKPA